MAKRNTYAWTKLRDQVVAEEPVCWLQFPEICTYVSTTADHVLSRKARPDLAMVRSNLRGACGPCNHARSTTPVGSLRLGDVNPSALSIFD
jgi:5-methylcytosine-specific restriction endonuclease McrA